MALILPLNPNKLTYPSGVPGYNAAHPASQGGVSFSWAALGGGFNAILPYGNPNFLFGAPPNKVYPYLGPTVNFRNATGDSLAFKYGPAVSSLSFSVLTIAAIYSIQSVSNGGGAVTPERNTLLSLMTGTGSSGVALNSINQNGVQNIFTINGANFSLTTNIPYFVAISVVLGSASAVPNIVVKNLATGAVLAGVGNTINSGVFSTTTEGFCVIGNEGLNLSGNELSGNISAAMFSLTSFLSVPKLLAWSDDPWSFWYPSGLDTVDMLRTSAAPFTWLEMTEEAHRLPKAYWMRGAIAHD